MTTPEFETNIAVMVRNSNWVILENKNDIEMGVCMDIKLVHCYVRQRNDRNAINADRME